VSTGEEDPWSARFVQYFRAQVPTSSDRELADTLEPEVQTVLASIVEAVGVDCVADPQSPALRESLTLASLLGRRAALLDATPMAALTLAPAIVHSLEGELDLTPLLEPLRVASVDGYVRGKDERADLVSEQRAGQAIAAVRLVPRCFAVFFRGVQSAEQIERVVGDLGRALLDGDARACIVDASGLCEPDRERAGQLFAVHATCVMLGVRCVFTGVPIGYLDAAKERGIELEDVRFADDLPAALDDALEACGLQVRPPSPIGQAFKRLLGA